MQCMWFNSRYMSWESEQDILFSITLWQQHLVLASALIDPPRDSSLPRAVFLLLRQLPHSTSPPPPLLSPRHLALILLLPRPSSPRYRFLAWTSLFLLIASFNILATASPLPSSLTFLAFHPPFSRLLNSPHLIVVPRIVQSASSRTGSPPPRRARRRASVSLYGDRRDGILL